jgi:hypothetical protein
VFLYKITELFLDSSVILLLCARRRTFLTGELVCWLAGVGCSACGWWLPACCWLVADGWLLACDWWLAGGCWLAACSWRLWAAGCRPLAASWWLWAVRLTAGHSSLKVDGSWSSAKMVKNRDFAELDEKSTAKWVENQDSAELGEKSSANWSFFLDFAELKRDRQNVRLHLLFKM